MPAYLHFHPGSAWPGLDSLHLFDFSQKGATRSRDLGKIIRYAAVGFGLSFIQFVVVDISFYLFETSGI